MSKTIDTKVVEMQFDNRQFERGINQSMSSIDRLKASLNFGGGSFGKLASGLGTITTSFNSFGVMAKRILENVADTAYSAGARIIKSLSIDQISEGWRKYEQIVSSTQTIMAATKTNWIQGTEAFENYAKTVEAYEKKQKNKVKKTVNYEIDAKTGKKTGNKMISYNGAFTETDERIRKQKQQLIDLTKNQVEQMKFVNEQLGKLNWYTDETSYDLVDMTANIGKFTSAGVSLKDATSAMMGIASWAAISGANSQQASRAMYNLSQAMGMGALKVQDWMSIENANMATLEFKETAMKTAYAMGVLKKNADGTFYTFDKKGHKIIVTAENFRSTLSANWFNSKVITQTLKNYGDFANDLYEYTEKTGLTATQLLKYTDKVKKGLLDVNDAAKMSELGKELGLDEKQLAALTEGLTKMSSATKDLGFNAFRAAQEAKTFTEAIKYVKDAVSTGWMNTFKTIFGDYLSAKDLWTEVAEEFYDLFVLDVERQNDVLKKWADMGGREQLLWGIKRLWRSIKSVITTIKTTFKEVFPPQTGEYLYDISVKFHNAMNSMEKATKPLCQRIRSILLPLFRGLKNIIESVVNIAKAVKNAFKNIFSATDINILEDATKLFEKLTDKFKITEERGKKLQTFFEGLFSILDIIKILIQEVLRALFGMDDKTDDIADGALDVAASFGKWVKSVRDWLVENKSLKKLAQWIANFIKDLPGKINEVCKALTGLDFKDWLDKLIKEDLPALADWIGKHLPGIKDDLEKANKTLETTEKVVGGVAKGLNDIVRLGLWFGGLATDTNELNKSLSSLKLYLEQVGKDIKEKIKLPQSTEEWAGLFKKIKTWLQIIVSFVTILTLWEKIQAWKAPFVNIVNGAKGFFGVLDALKFNIKINALLKIVSAVKDLVLMIILMSILPTKKVHDAANVVIGILMMISGIMAFMSKAKIDAASMTTLNNLVDAISVAIFMATASIFVMAHIAEKNMKGLIAASVILPLIVGMLVGAAYSLSKIKISESQLMGIAASMFILSAAMLGIGAAIMLATTNGDWRSVAAAGLAIAAILAAMCLSLKIMPKDNDIANAAGSLLVLSAALVLVSVSLALVAGIGDPGKLVAAGAALAIMLSAMAGALFILSKAGNGAGLIESSGALLVAAASIIALAVALRIVAEVVASGNAVGAVLVLAGALGALVLAALLCSNPAVTAALYAIGAACALIGVGALAAGAGLVLFASAVERLAAVGPEGITLLISAIKQFILLLPDIAVKIGQAIIALLDTFVQSRDKVVQILAGLINILFDVLIQTAPKLFEFLGTVIQGVCQLLIDKAPIIAESIIVVTRESLRMLREIIPELTSTLFAILLDTLRQIRDNIEEIVSLSVEIGILTITGFVKGITEQIPNLVNTGWEFVLALINGIADGVDHHAKELREAIEKLANAIINGFCTVLGIHSPSTVFESFGGNIIGGLVKGLKENAKEAWNKIKEVAREMVNKIGEGLSDFFEKGKSIIFRIRDGLINAKDTVVSKMTEIGDKIKSAISDKFNEFVNVGKNIINGIKKGLSDNEVIKKIKNAAKKVADAIPDTVKKALKIASPSKVFIEIGKYIDQGLAVGLDKYSVMATNASEDVGNAALDSMKAALAKASETIENDVDAEPTIRPVLDLTDITNGVGTIDDMLSADRAINLAAYSSGSMNANMANQQTMSSMFDSLKSTLSNLMSNNQNGVVNNNTFNVSGDDPKAIAEEISRILQNQVERRDAAWA